MLARARRALRGGRRARLGGALPRRRRARRAPAYPWQRERHWFDALDARRRAAGRRPARASAARPPRPRRREAALGGARSRDDRASRTSTTTWSGGTIPFPGAGYVEMGLAASRRLLGHAAPGVRDVEFRRALFLGGTRAARRPARGRPGVAPLRGAQRAARRRRVDAARRRRARGRRPTDRRTDLDDAARALRPGRGRGRRSTSGSRSAASSTGRRSRGSSGRPRRDGEAVGEVALDLDVDALRAAPGAPRRGAPAADRRRRLDRRDRRRRRSCRCASARCASTAGRARAFHVHARTTRRRRAFAGDVDVLAPDGDGARRGARARVPLPRRRRRARARRSRDWLYELRWEARRSAALRPTGSGELGASADGSDWADYYDEVEPVLDEAAAGFALAAFRELGPAADASCAVAPAAARLRSGARRGPCPSRATRASCSRARRRAGRRTRSTRRCSPAAARARPPSSPGARTPRASSSRDGADAARALLPRGADRPLLQRPARRRRRASSCDGRPLRVLEVGAGTGGTTVHLLARAGRPRRLPLHRRLVATSPRARRAEFGGNATSRPPCSTSSATRPSRGSRPAAFDVVVAANVLHATADLGARSGTCAACSRRAARSCCSRSRGGALARRCLRAHRRLVGVRRPRPRAARAGRVERAARAQGFTAPPRSTTRPPHGAPGPVRARRRAAGGRAAGTGSCSSATGGVAARLEAAGATCSHRSPTPRSPTGSSIVARRSRSRDVRARRAGRRAARARRATGCGVLDAARRGRRRELVLVTAGGAGGGRTPERFAVAQAPLWGLGRVIVKERLDLRCRLDRPRRRAGRRRARRARGRAARGAGRRAGARAARRPPARPAAAPARPAARRDAPPRRAVPGDCFRRADRQPGRARDVAWSRSRSRALGPGEVEIEVDAASLNFRDVMLALGLLPARAIEEIAGADRLGLDCAGTVVAVGDEVDGVAVGDEVLAATAPAARLARPRAARSSSCRKPAGLAFDRGGGDPDRLHHRAGGARPARARRSPASAC